MLHRSDLSLEERKEYTDAVLCLMEKPALTSAAAPGAKSRFDDYVSSTFGTYVPVPLGRAAAFLEC
jgi:hypothetical protein